MTTPDGAMRLRSVHPGVRVEDVVGRAGLPLEARDDGVTERPYPDERAERRRETDPHGVLRPMRVAT